MNTWTKMPTKINAETMLPPQRTLFLLVIEEATYPCPAS